MREIVLIKVSGEDRRGVTESLSRVMAAHGVNILDIGQSVIHSTLIMGILAEFPEHGGAAQAIQEMQNEAHARCLRLEFEPLSEEQYEAWVAEQGRPHWIVTMLARRVTSAQIAAVSGVIAKHQLNIDVINRLSGRRSLRGEQPDLRACIEFSLVGHADDDAGLRADLVEIAREHTIDIAFQHDNVYRRNRRLVVFDMDSTLIQCEVIDELAQAAGAGEAVSRITECAMRGELDFKQSFAQRLAMLKGLDEAVLEEIAARLPLTEGAERLIGTLKALGYKTAIISGGFRYFGEHLQQLLGIDYVFANELEIVGGKVTGRAVGDVIDGARKAELLRDVAQREGISLEQTIAIGDGANDLPMINLAGLGIAFHAKPLVQAGARHAISTHGLDGILYLIGMRDRDVVLQPRPAKTLF